MSHESIQSRFGAQAAAIDPDLLQMRSYKYLGCGARPLEIDVELQAQLGEEPHVIYHSPVFPNVTILPAAPFLRLRDFHPVDKSIRRECMGHSENAKLDDQGRLIVGVSSLQHLGLTYETAGKIALHKRGEIYELWSEDLLPKATNIPAINDPIRYIVGQQQLRADILKDRSSTPAQNQTGPRAAAA